MNNILSKSLNRNLINIIGEFLLPSNVKVMIDKYSLFAKPSANYKIAGFGNIKSQALQFKLRKYGKYLDTFTYNKKNDRAIINFLVSTKDYDLLFPTPDLLAYVSEIDLTDPQNKENFYVFLNVRKIDILKPFRNFTYYD